MLRLDGCEVGTGAKGFACPFTIFLVCFDRSEIPHFAYGLDLLAFRNIPRTPSYQLLGWPDITCAMEARLCKILRYHIDS